MGSFPSNWSGEAARYLRRICAASVRAAQRDPRDWIAPVWGCLRAEVRYDDTTGYWEIHAQAGVPVIQFHDLRHSHPTLLLAAGTHPKVVSERLGHATISITLDTYAHVLPGMQRDAAAQLDALFR